MKCYFSVDVGGTNIKIGKFIEDCLVEKYFLKTNDLKFSNDLLKKICISIQENLDNDELIGLGIGVPGPVINDTLLMGNNIGLDIINIKNTINKYFDDIPVSVLNDANAVALGETKYQGIDNAVVLTIGTGLGCGVIINGKVCEGSTGSCGEIGHINYEKNGRKCNCGLVGCLEQYVSAKGIEMTYNGNLSCQKIFDLAKKNNQEALNCINEFTDALVYALNIICVTFNPKCIILGGGVSESGEFLLDIVKNKFLEKAYLTVKGTKIMLSKLGNDAGVYGNYYAIRRENEKNNL